MWIIMVGKQGADDFACHPAFSFCFPSVQMLLSERYPICTKFQRALACQRKRMKAAASDQLSTQSANCGNECPVSERKEAMPYMDESAIVYNIR